MIEVLNVAEGVYKVTITETDFDRLQEMSDNRKQTNSEGLSYMITCGMALTTDTESEKEGDDDV